ncbi:MAG: hypothetical protein VR69_13555 [Peptococcaceae bacterium BRH_c4b]|nr:MAG: hypothetical protein VR69_13555 [Peptococcaceae bacterium BRH_c4b]
MKIVYYPDQQTVNEAMQVDDPLLVLIKHDLNEILICNIDDAGEHHILLRKLNIHENDIDKYFRIIVNNDGADWTFVCPAEYKKITDRVKRIERFYADGIKAIRKALDKLHYNVDINIPQRYRRHIDIFKE